jgi:hypothetical protein
MIRLGWRSTPAARLAKVLLVLGHYNSVFGDGVCEDDVVGLSQPVAITRMDSVMEA